MQYARRQHTLPPGEAGTREDIAGRVRDSISGEFSYWFLTPTLLINPPGAIPPKSEEGAYFRIKASPWASPSLLSFIPMGDHLVAVSI